ncbi:MAG: 50S ribosomal protein L21 [Fusobacteria bacterium]|jgi:large subunit ribosomal protein L21|nr:50S ribosomal protein L21 [Fusobacteriota bacterium]
MYAIIKTGGKQYKVEEGQKLKVEKLSLDVDSEVTFEEVLLVSDGKDIKVGKPFLENAKVVATVVDNGKHKKVVSFKYKPKTGFHKKIGHRQNFTEVEIKSIVS